MTTTTIILILSVAVAVLTVVVAVMVWLFVRKNRELKKKNEVIIREIYHSQNIIERAVKHGVSRAALLTALLAWLLPQTAGATHVDDTWKYQVSLNGSNTIRIQVPVYDQEGADCWVSNGNLKVTWDGVTKTCFHWQRNGDTDSDSKDIYIHFSTEVGGSFDITQGNSGSHFTMTQGGDYERLIYRNGDGNTYTVYAVWRVPYDMLGKKLTFSWDVERDGNSRSKEKVSGLNDEEIVMPSAPTVIHPQVTMSTMSYSEAGKLELPWFMASDKITSLRYQYTDAYGIEVREDLSTKDNNGKIYLDATVPHDNFTIVVSYKDADNYDISNVSSTTQNLAMIHAPVGLTATQLDDGKAKVKVQLDWHVRFPSTDDLAASDFFEVQRSLTGQEADFVTLGTVPVVIDAKDPHFTYTDSTIVSALVAEHLTGGSSLTNLTYRVRRMITQSWGWNHNCAQRVETSVSGLHLLRLKNYTATLTDERSYSVRVNWEYGSEPNAVWDSRAKLMMEVTMRNNAGELVDTKTYELSEDERNARQKTIDLSRTCVKYDIRMYVDPGTSPLRSWDQPDAIRIASVADWNTFRSKVQEAKGQYDVNAILCTDISTTASCGDNGYPYRGTFDGNGHTLTVNISTGNQYEAPFKFVKDATFRNLRTAGTIKSSQKFIGGIAARTDGNVVIENCRSSVTIDGRISGDATNGGLVAVYGGGGQLTITDCLFDGVFTGYNSFANGGFVGWSDGKINIVNGHFAPSKIETRYTGCRTWARMRDNKNLTVTNSHFTKSYDESTTALHIIRSKADWTVFRDSVQNALGKKDVNALLDADLSLTNDDIIGYIDDYNSCSYRGTFDGNGHTLNITLNKESHLFALFLDVTASTTIKNLRVTGTVNGYYDVAALVGNCSIDCTDLNIDHVHVSANVTASATPAGGFVGYVNVNRKNCQINITDCLYDGKLTTNNWSPQTAGCFIGNTDNPKDRYGWHQTRVYERSSAQGPGKTGYGMNMWHGASGSIWATRPWSDTDCCLSSHDFQEVPEDCRNITDQDTVIVRMNASMPGQWEKDGSGNAVPIISMTGARLLAALGPCWQMTGGTVIPKTATVSVNPSALPDFYHEGTGRIDKVAHAETRQSSVVLTWTVDGGVVDYFRVYRRVEGTTEWGEPIADQIDKMGYEDTTVSPLLKYEYKVVAVADCEGLHTSETDVVKGSCKNTGRVSGYVRMNDGTSVAGIEVEIVPEGHSSDKTTVTTDDNGYFVADELSYYGGQSITYTVTPVSGDNIKLERGSMPVTFDNKSNDETLPEFTITSGHRFSGYVMYEGTSIPVKGARFRVDGHDVHNAAGDLVETAYDGSFSFRVLGGTRRIQAVMDGHTFTDGGYYKGSAGHNFTDDVAQIYFYDATKVRLAGRVVGGDDQGSLPLQNNLSRNNLGDDLTMVFTLEGDNTSWLIYDNLNPTLSERTDSIMHTGGKHKTKYTVYRKRMEVKPDSVTGEYELLLPPVRWKVQQVYCKGYATLFQDGQVSEVVDLTDCLNPRDSICEGYYTDVDEQTIYSPHETANARYSRIYHAPVEITYRQLGYDSFDYFGDRTYYATALDGTKAEVPLVYEGKIVAYKDSIVGYKDVITGYKDATTGNTIVFDENETHTPKLTATDGVYTTARGWDESTNSVYYEYYTYENLFDGDVNTKWNYYKYPAWFEFKTDKPVSVKQYTMTTVKYNGSSAGSCPKSWTLKARVDETDAWKTISAYEDGHMTDSEVKAFNFDVADQGFYQYFRLEVTAPIRSNDNSQLAELSLTCRGKEGIVPVPVYETQPIIEKFPITVGGVLYTFGHPVFSVERKYPIEISVGERYIYNNDTRTGREDRVSVGGGTVTVHNGMKNGLDQETVELNAEGQGIFYLMAEATPRLLTGDDALRTVTMTLTQDGTTYEAEPLRGYVLNLFATGEGKDVLASGTPLLIDILRDPPGSGSSATLSKGSTLKLSYEVEMQFKGGLTLEFGYGTALDTYNGVVAAGKENGTINGTDLTNLFSLDVIFSGAGKKAYAYTMNVDEDITTSSAPNMTGADADLYIGVVQNTVVTPMSTIRAIPDAMYQQMLGSKGGSIKGGTSQGDSITVKSKYGSMVEIAQGIGADGSLYHLVRDVSLGYGPQVTSQFIHSQKYITTELLPKLVQEIRDLLFTGTRDEAVALANTTGKAVYWSKVAADHKDFGTTGAYEMIKPTGKTGLKDEVLEKYNNMVLWIEMIMTNEREKLWAYDKVANYDVDGGAAVTHSESFESEYSQSQYISYPFTTADYFETDGQSWKDRLSAAAGALLSQPGLVSAANALAKLINDKANATRKDDDNNVQRVHISFFGNDFQFGLKPVAEYSSIGTYGSQNNYSRKESFNIVMGSKSHLSVDVFRVLTETTDTTKVKDVSWLDVYHNVNFNEWAEIMKNHVKDGISYEGVNYSKTIYPRSFVYRTRGGATANPWENARYTIAYQPGTLLDERTKKIENPKITADRQSVSGVPYGETARFTIYLTNDSEDPEAAGRSLTTYTLYADDSSNPYGAKITCDGKPLDTDGRKIILSPGEVVTKVIEVSGGNAFDLEGLTIGIASEEDWRQIYDELSLDVHYLHQAGPVNISLPGDKWVMNTNAQYDKDRGWFMPVIIDGFDRHQHNFDHIELQYKESLRGDDAWTNLCSYYADEALMKAASGEREMIPENGNIEAHFYGEGTVMEKAYDLRAVLYCRNGNSFLTTASPIVSGVKDTRRPQLFGTPEPKDGLLGIGDNIIFNFTEDIEYNYLNAITNFEVKGEVNKDNVSEAVSLQFTGNGSVESEAQRNFSGKDLTIDLMICPDETGRDMPLFSHGTNGKKLQLWLTSDRKLKAIIDDQTFVSTDTIVKGGFTQVALSISQADSILTFYNGGKTIGQAKLTEPYNGTGRLIFGRTNETDRSQSTFYSGRMMEARLWYRAMTGGEVGTTYGSRRLSGYEMGLVDYYPMNEGSGDYAVDHTQGANAQLMGASWAMPRGWSLRLDNDGVALKQQALARTAEQDYTMMFWFKTADADGTLVSNGEGVANEAGAQNRFWLGFDDGTLAFRSNGMTVEAGSGYNDDQWHHYAMTVNRARGVANIYVDQALKATFAPDSIGGISGGTPYIGACVLTATDNTANAPARSPLAAPTAATGNIVDIGSLHADYVAQDGDVLTGTLGTNVKISVADGATITFNGVTIKFPNTHTRTWAGITCSGDATIVLSGENTVKGINAGYPGIHIAKGKTLTIKGDGSLTVSGTAGIGGGEELDCGNIVIEAGTINASGYNGGACIGGGKYGSCGNITITGGNITAEPGGGQGAGIGSGHYASCGNINITGGIINATGDYNAAGIGGGWNGSCGDITITDGVTSLTATKGEGATNSIGAGKNGSVGTITIGGTVYSDGITESPYTFAPVKGISLNKTSTTLTVGSSETLTATVIPDNATDKSVTWATSNASVATVADGMVTAVGPGTATITVTTVDGGYTATCTVTVTQPTTGVTLNKVNTTLAVGSTETLTATVYPTDATDKSVTWKTSNAAVATVANGTVTGVAPGIATITVTSSNGSTATCEVTVIQPTTGVTLNKTSITLTAGSTERLTATVAPDNATDKSVTWTTSNANVATVTDGVVYAVNAGTATITVTTTDGAKTATCEVIVRGTIVGQLTGNLDELCMFQQALPLTLIKAYATKSPQGDEAGLLTYLSFDRQERQKDNSIETVAYPWSKKIYLDDMGEVRYELDPVTKQATSTPVRDYVFVLSQDEVLRHITSETAAPVVPYEELTNLKFSFAGKDNQVLVGIDELTQRINHRNIYVTLRDVEDKNGNAMASPQTACYYVNSSSLQWLANRVTRTVAYGAGEELYFGVENKSATSRTYTIENCPKWLTLDKYSDVVPAQDMVLVTAMVNPSLNVGSYDEIIYLTDEDGVKEPLYLSLTVEGEQPEWAEGISGDLLQHSMNIAGRVLVNDEIDIDSRDIVGAFGRDGQCHGYANISYSALTGESNLYLTVYDNQASGRDLYFKLWQYSTGRELVLTPPAPITFQNGTVLGTDEPVLFKAGTEYVQTFDLAAGWNWVSFNVASEKLFNLGTLLDGLPWKEGDVLTDMNSDATLIYRDGHWLVSGGASVTSLSQKNAYAIMVHEPVKFPIAGNVIKQLDMRTIELKQGWNGIGYTPMLNLPIETALSDYYDKAQPGDVIKSHDQFAYFTVTGGVGRWKGSLEYMKPGEGYMLLRKAESATSFVYPFYEPGSTFIDEWSYSTARAAAPARAKATMSVSAVVEGVEMQEGDRLVAFADGEVVGAATAVSGETADHTEPLYLSIEGDKQQGIWFAIERDGEIVAATSEQMTFTANAVIGSPDEPTKISFVQTDREDGKWYTVSGIQLLKQPTRSGVYIFNGKKVVIK